MTGIDHLIGGFSAFIIGRIVAVWAKSLIAVLFLMSIEHELTASERAPAMAT